MTPSPRDLYALQAKVWEGSVPLEIRLASAECTTYGLSNPFLIHVPRISYLPLLLPKLHAFFMNSLINEKVNFWDGWLSYENVPLKWHYPVGLLYDLYSGVSDAQDGNGGRKGSSSEEGEDQNPSDKSRAWKLILHFEDWPSETLARLDDQGRNLKDAFTNSFKEASFVRHGSGKVVMALGKEDSTQMWEAIVEHDLKRFYTVSQKLFHAPGANLRHLPMKIYLPAAADIESTDAPTASHLKVVQVLVTPALSSRQPQTVGTALNSILPSVFPSRRNSLMAVPILHGSVVPLSTTLESLAEGAAYADGFLHIAVVMMVP